MPVDPVSALPTYPRIVRTLVAVLLTLLLAGCAGTGSGAPGADGGSSTIGSPDPAAATAPPSLPVGAMASGDVGAELCRRVADVQSRLISMRAVELRVPNRVALDIELGQLQVAVGELLDAELGSLEDELETPRTRLGHRLREVELAIEDFRTNSRPHRAVPHVEEDTQTFADELAAFTILARC
jgi:hypothetical protein